MRVLACMCMRAGDPVRPPSISPSLATAVCELPVFLPPINQSTMVIMLMRLDNTRRRQSTQIVAPAPAACHMQHSELTLSTPLLASSKILAVLHRYNYYGTRIMRLSTLMHVWIQGKTQPPRPDANYHTKLHTRSSLSTVPDGSELDTVGQP